MNVPASRQVGPPNLSFRGRAVSPEANAFVSHCLEEIVLPTIIAERRRPSTLSKIRKATEGTLIALMVAGRSRGGWLRRPKFGASLTAQGAVSRRQFEKVYGAFLNAGLIEAASGYYKKTGPVSQGRETRLRLASRGKVLAASFGVDKDVRIHISTD
jgi:hypothetical protein